MCSHTRKTNIPCIGTSRRNVGQRYRRRGARCVRPLPAAVDGEHPGADRRARRVRRGPLGGGTRPCKLSSAGNVLCMSEGFISVDALLRFFRSRGSLVRKRDAPLLLYPR